MPFLPYGRHSIDDDDIAAVAEVLRGDWLTTGPKIEAFEEAFAKRVGAPFAVACSSGTAGLHLSMSAHGLGEGDVVIVPSMTFLATANAARYVGAEVVLADVNADTGLLDCPGLAAAVKRSGGKAKAVVPVHMNGQSVDMAMVAEATRDLGLTVIEDACHAIGATARYGGDDDIPIGACPHSDMAVFSLHPVKLVAMGEGGVVTTNHESLYDRVRRFRNHGIERNPARFANRGAGFDKNGEVNPWYYEMDELGFNYRASDIHCALGLSQLGKLDRFLARRRDLAALYDQVLAPLAPLLRPVPRMLGSESGWHLYVVLIDFDSAGIDRATLMRDLRDRGIGTQVHYIPLHHQPYYRRRYGEISLPGADKYYTRCLSLPLFPAMADEDVYRVADSLGLAIKGAQ